MELEFRYPNIPPVYIPDQNLIGIYEPHIFPSPIASPQIREIASQTHWLGLPMMEEESWDKQRILLDRK